MNRLRGYFQPASTKASTKASKNDKKKSKPTATAVAPETEMTTTPSLGSPALTLSRHPLSSRPSSVFPDGDFRNAPVESVLDIKTTVMVSWLHQQQVEKLWSTSLPGEGVILKKSRDSFTCCPPSLRNHEAGLFDYVAAMNVRVRFYLLCLHIQVFQDVLNEQDVPSHGIMFHGQCAGCASNPLK